VFIVVGQGWLYRLWRRQQRKAQAARNAQLATLQAMQQEHGSL